MKFDISSIGNGLVDMLGRVADDVITELELRKGHTLMIDSAKILEIQKTLADVKWETTVGGSALNTIRISAELGLSNYFSTRVGNDELGELLLKKLDALKIKYDISKSDKLETGRVISLITPDAERTMVSYIGAADEYSITHVQDFDAVKSSKLFYFTGYKLTNESMKEVVFEAVKHAKKNKTLVAFDLADSWVIESHLHDIRYILPNCDIIFMNKDEANTISGSVDEAIADFSKTASITVVKVGKEGCVVKANNELYKIPGYAVDALDTTGAGDSFAAGFLYGLVKGFSIPDSAKLANFVGSKVVCNMGSVLAEKDIKDIQLFIKNGLAHKKHPTE